MSARITLTIEAGPVGAEFTGELPPDAPLIRAGGFVDRERLKAAVQAAADQIGDELDRQLATKKQS